jgi:hypothetical protein
MTISEFALLVRLDINTAAEEKASQDMCRPIPAFHPLLGPSSLPVPLPPPPRTQVQQSLTVVLFHSTVQVSVRLCDVRQSSQPYYPTSHPWNISQTNPLIPAHKHRMNYSIRARVLYRLFTAQNLTPTQTHRLHSTTTTLCIESITRHKGRQWLVPHLYVCSTLRMNSRMNMNWS